MRFAIAYGKDNIAGKNIVEEFKKLGFAPQVPIIELVKDSVYMNGFDSKCVELKGIDFLVFASTHRSEKGAPSLCLHAPGNWRGADLGGKSGKVCKTSAFVLKYLFKELEKNWSFSEGVKEKYNLTLEVTHHGPLVDIPCCFIEVGSSEEEWKDLEACRVVAKSILSLQNYKKQGDWEACIGIGGPHYAPNFNKIQLNSKYAVGHIIPEYALPLSSGILKEAESKVVENVEKVLVDWKGCGRSESRNEVVGVVEESGLVVVRTGGVEK